VIGVDAPIFDPGAGLATALACCAPAGNQLTACGVALSHVRGAPATCSDPAGPDLGSSTVSWGEASVWWCIAPGCPYETTCTACVNRTPSGWPERNVTNGVLTAAAGVVRSRRTRSVEPVSQEMEPGRLTTTSIDSRCPARMTPRGQI
jgi:hypothetical protein